MPNWLESLRLKSLFGLPEDEMVGNDLPSQGGITGNIRPTPDFGSIFNPRLERLSNYEMETPETVGPIEGKLPDIASRMSSLYSPETTASDRFNKMIDEVPVRNKPGFLSKLAASMVGLTGGSEASEKIMYSPYYRELEDWKTKIDPAYKAATLERQSNVNERMLAYQSVATQLREEAQNAKEANDIRRSDIAQQRANIYAFKAQNPNKRFDFSGITVLVADPVTGEVTDTKVPTGSMTDLDKIMLQQLGREELEEQRQGGRIGLEGIRQGNRVKLLQERETIRKQKLTEDKRLSVGQDAAAWKLARQQYITDNPSHTVFWDNTGLPSTDAEDDDTGIYEMAVDDIRQRYNRIKSRATPGKSTSSVTTTGTTEKKYRRNKTTGEVQISTDGGKTWQPFSQ